MLIVGILLFILVAALYACLEMGSRADDSVERYMYFHSKDRNEEK